MLKKNVLRILCVVCGSFSVFGLSIQVGSKAIFLPVCGVFFPEHRPLFDVSTPKHFSRLPYLGTIA